MIEKARQAMDLNTILLPKPFKSRESAFGTLKKLKRFGSTAFRSDFCFPEKEDLEEMDEDLPIKIATLKYKKREEKWITAIQVIYTNGVESEIFMGKHNKEIPA